MLKHIVLVKFKPDAPREEIVSIVNALRALPPVISEIRGYEVAEDILQEARSFDLAIVATYDDVPALRRYQSHPAHVPILERLKANSTQIVAVDFE